METRDILKSLREKKKLTQDQLAEHVMVTRQAVSRWETGETQPNTETLKLLSKEFNVSINTLLGSPRKLVCQCCGMPLDEDALISKEPDGSFNDDYCKWCYDEGKHVYSDMEDLIRVCAPHMTGQGMSEEQACSYLKQYLPTLDYWKKYKEIGGEGQYALFKKKLMEEFNDLHVDGLPKVETLCKLKGKDMNLAYRLPNGRETKFLDDNAAYLGNRMESEFGGDRRFGIVAGMDFLLVCTFEKDGENPELVLYKHR